MRAFLPRLISPFLVAGPSAMTCPALISSPLSTMGRWLTQVPWFERMNLMSSYSSVVVLEVRMMILSAVTFSTTPSFLASTQTPESQAALYSMPVATMGCWVTISGTACRCMFEPIRARLASSFSRKGIMAVATETTILGETSI